MHVPGTDDKASVRSGPFFVPPLVLFPFVLSFLLFHFHDVISHSDFGDRPFHHHWRSFALLDPSNFISTIVEGIKTYPPLPQQVTRIHYKISYHTCPFVGLFSSFFSVPLVDLPILDGFGYVLVECIKQLALVVMPC